MPPGNRRNRRGCRCRNRPGLGAARHVEVAEQLGVFAYPLPVPSDAAPFERVVEKVEMRGEVRPLGVGIDRRIVAAANQRAAQMPTVVENKPREYRNPFAIRVAGKFPIAELQHPTHRMRLVAGRPLPAAKIAGVAVEIPETAGDPVEREPSVAIENPIVPHMPVIGEHLGFDRVVANANEIITNDVNIRVQPWQLSGIGTVRLHAHAIKGVADSVAAYDDLAGDALRRQKAAVEIAEKTVRSLIAVGPPPIEPVPEIVVARVVLLPIVVFDQQVRGFQPLGENRVGRVAQRAVANLQVA